MNAAIFRFSFYFST
ncbi:MULTISPECIES: pheST operon leader peptide PheM [Enterobacteriaceae]|nr:MULTISPECIES: pheST operon leader peptide PheM [Enterobacteriaceae]EEZ7612129.1 pheST operon leader peptide PheM [Escherichia coli]EGI2952093.1 pheST operon leader peptide PheM [Salmonella enterica]EFB4088558.1 pheST operon leader peptide PheM [Escherichia coli]EFC3466584.1 pheST operon leader peptide PheM [Escherichia coli]EFU8400369.1 pheST operon leader peptide PheM [Escherichia coli]